jgi:hypothetical protein
MVSIPAGQVMRTPQVYAGENERQMGARRAQVSGHWRVIRDLSAHL